MSVLCSVKKKKKKHNVETYNRTLAPFFFFFNYFRSPLQSNRLIQQHFLSLSVEHRNKSLSFFSPSFFFLNLLLAVVVAYVTLSLTLSSSMSCASSLRACAIECREASSPSWKWKINPHVFQPHQGEREEKKAVVEKCVCDVLWRQERSFSLSLFFFFRCGQMIKRAVCEKQKKKPSLCKTKKKIKVVDRKKKSFKTKISICQLSRGEKKKEVTCTIQIGAPLTWILSFSC